jgi:cytoskeletal protein CcmA (bactofilin family)
MALNQTLRLAPLRHAVFALATLVGLGALGGCGQSMNGDDSNKVNGSVHVAAGKAPDVAETVNGAVDIDPNAVVTAATTVNGSIHLGSHAAAQSVTTVNGSITLDAGARVSGAVATVNGGITLRDDADVAGSLQNVNGNIALAVAHVAGGIKTVDGNIDIRGGSRVEHGILVQKPASEFFHLGGEVPRIIIGPGATVQGELRFERPVQLYVSDRATIGPVVGTTATTFTGDAPPG